MAGREVVILAYRGDAEAHGAMLAVKSGLSRASVRDGGFELEVEGAETIACGVLINSAGLRAPTVAKSIEGYPARMAPGEFYAKGNYYSLSRKNPFKRLIYPVPEPGGLGVHVTLDLAGQARFGPDVEWIDRINYDVDPRPAERFYAAIRRYWPGLPDHSLSPGYAGIRPKTAGLGGGRPGVRTPGPRTPRARGRGGRLWLRSPRPPPGPPPPRGAGQGM